MTAALDVADLRVRGDAGAYLDIDRLVVEDGELAVLVGGTGSGKTLLAAVITGKAAADGGTVSVDGRALRGGPAARRRRGLAATVADGSRIAGCTVFEALRLAAPHRATAALDRFPLLASRARVRAELLSGGEQQLLQVACAWCSQPRVLVLDTPTTGLADDVAELVSQTARDTAAGGSGVLWIDQSEATAPGIAGWRLAGGALSEVRGVASPSDPA